MTNIERASAFLGGEALTFAEADNLWKNLVKEDELSRARAVLAHIRSPKNLLDGPLKLRNIREELCRQHAMLTSKDSELSVSIRHDLALEVLNEEFDLQDAALDGKAETLGIAGGIYKRRWQDLGQMQDLKTAAALYDRGAKEDLGEDAYAHINAAFLDDVLAKLGDHSAARRDRAYELRNRIVRELPVTGTWWNTASRAEALFGLGRYKEATDVIANAQKPEPWKLQTTARQLGELAHLREERPLEVQDIRDFFQALLPGAIDAARSVIIGKVGLALSGGGFRASFYHLGVLARLAELDVLRHIDVLSCVSGGSIIGACYWLMLRQRLLQSKPLEHSDYIQLIADLIEHFQSAVATNLRGQIQPSIGGALRQLWNERGVLDPEPAAKAFQQWFYGPLIEGSVPIYMHQLEFTPGDHSTTLMGSETFHPSKHNWLRANKVPALILNATTVNTGHAWQFTPTWMGESPWAVHEEVDSVSRLEWAWYAPKSGWQIELSRAVAASACVPGVFAPLKIEGAFENGLQVHLVDGGIYDNQGTVSLLALNCNVVLVSDACGQLLLENSPDEGLKGLKNYAKRAMDTLMERVRLANYADLSARKRSGLLRGLMFLHMKAGLDADTIRRTSSQETYELKRTTLSPSGIRKEFQKALAELRTDLDAFTEDESLSLMACGYQMASKAFQRDLVQLRELWTEPLQGHWPFKEILNEITSAGESSTYSKELVASLIKGSVRKIWT